jgi:hypothetical protein
MLSSSRTLDNRKPNQGKKKFRAPKKHGGRAAILQRCAGKHVAPAEAYAGGEARPGSVNATVLRLRFGMKIIEQEKVIEHESEMRSRAAVQTAKG